MPEVRLVRASERNANTAQTAGLQRFEAVSARMTGATALWMGYSVLPPGGKTGAHHHGDSETAIYMLSGVGRWRVGEQLDRVVEVHPGDFLFIPPHAVHLEENPSETQPAEMIVARSTQEAIVVNLDEPVSGTTSR
jgi:uncharacterized RmlC-like cupin family protein